MKIHKKGLFIVVNYNTWDHVCLLYENLKPYLDINIDLIIIDSNSSDKCPNIFLDEASKNLNVKIIFNNANLGYYNSVQSVFDSLLINNYSYFIVSNCDVEIINNDFFTILESELDQNTIIAPNVINNQGFSQNPFRLNKPNYFVKFFWNIYYLSYGISRLMTFFVLFIKSFLNKISKRKLEVPVRKYIYAPHGSFIIYPKLIFEQIFSFKFPFFLYAEEDYISSIASHSGFRVFYIPELKLKHFENVSTGSMTSRSKFYIQREAYNKAIKVNW